MNRKDDRIKDPHKNRFITELEGIRSLQRPNKAKITS